MSPPQMEIKRTALYTRHQALGATMAPFSGWEMPLWYKTGAVKEHLAVIQAAGLFDTGHMDVLCVEGERSREFLNYAFTRDISESRPGRAAYGAFLDRDGHCLDDAIVYPFFDSRFGVVVNASMGPVIQHHLEELRNGGDIRIIAPATRPAKLDLQGPASAAILRSLVTDADEVFARLPYFSFKGDFDFTRSDVRLRDGTPILLSRTGYTGELGFELFLPVEKAATVWDAILREGNEDGLLPCGLAARDSLRTGAVLPLSHQDIGDWPFINHPWSFALPFTEDGAFGKSFVGSDALDAQSARHTLAFAGFDPRRVDPHEARARLDDRDIGKVLTIVSDMAIGRHEKAILGLASPSRPENWTPRGLACGFVLVDRHLDSGAEISLKDHRREIRVEIVSDIRPDRTARRKIVP